MLHFFRKFLVQNSGASAIEYAFIALLISIVMIAAVQFVGTQLSQTFTNVGSNLSTANAS